MSEETRKPAGKTGIFLELESLIIEYHNLFDRSNKLDNKVYIAITFCGFLFVFITSLFSGITLFDAQNGAFVRTVIVIYVLLCLAVMISYVYLLIYFLKLLKPENIIRMDPEILEAEKLAEVTEAEAAEKLIALYRKTINEDLEKLHLRCDVLTKGLGYIAVNVILAFCAYGLQLVVRIL